MKSFLAQNLWITEKLQALQPTYKLQRGGDEKKTKVSNISNYKRGQRF